MALSDRLAELTSRTQQLAEAASAARARNTARLEEQRSKLQASMAARDEQMRSRTAAAKTDVETWWAETSARVEQKRAEMEARRAQRSAEMESEVDMEFAQAAEDYASLMTAIAADMVGEATRATLDAGLAKKQAAAVKPTATVGS